MKVQLTNYVSLTMTSALTSQADRRCIEHRALCSKRCSPRKGGGSVGPSLVSVRNAGLFLLEENQGDISNGFIMLYSPFIFRSSLGEGRGRTAFSPPDPPSMPAAPPTFSSPIRPRHPFLLEFPIWVATPPAR